MPESTGSTLPEFALPPEAAAKLAEAKRVLSTVGGCALLIGVETYQGLAADKQLFAGRNDVLAYWRVCRRLGYRARHIRALTSPVLTPDDILHEEVHLALEGDPHRTRAEIEADVARRLADAPWGDMLGEATHDAIRAGVAWLAQHLVFTVKLEGDGWSFVRELTGVPGLLAYSGHGAQHRGDLALCPSDVGADLARALPFEELRAMIDAGDDLRAAGTPHPADNLTVVLDCCFAASSSARDGARVTSLTPAGAATPAAAKREIGNRVFCASARDERSSQAVLGGRWHGAFTWAFTRALEQWKQAPSGQFTKSTISHVELLFRTRMLLEALSFPQHPVLVDAIGNLPVFQHDSDVADDTSAEPTAERRAVQMDPGFLDFRVYTFTSGGRAVARVLVTKVAGHNNGSTYAADREYWHEVATPAATDLTVGWRDYSWAANPQLSLGALCFQMNRTPQVWQSKTAPPYGFNFDSANLFIKDRIALRWAVSNVAGTWSGWLEWYNDSGADNFFAGAAGSQTVLTAYRDESRLWAPMHWANVQPE
ncbi:MAG TPA: caspase family protein [Kofleriaceae bacterium]|nr:caspase family protein [Kofleriaceae bacterium]